MFPKKFFNILHTESGIEIILVLCLSGTGEYFRHFSEGRTEIYLFSLVYIYLYFNCLYFTCIKHHFLG